MAGDSDPHIGGQFPAKPPASRDRGPGRRSTQRLALIVTGVVVLVVAAAAVAVPGLVGKNVARWGAGTPSTAPASSLPATSSPTPSATSSPSVGPSGSGRPTTGPAKRCPPYPAFPDASCTGPTGMLAASNLWDFRKPGQIVQNIEIRSRGIVIEANNVTFRNVRLVYTGTLDDNFTMVEIQPGFTGTVFENCEIDGQNKVSRGIAGSDGVTVRNCNIHNTGNGVEVGGDKLTVEDSFIHSIDRPDGKDWHCDGIQSGASGNGVTIRHNTILLPGTENSAISIIGQPDTTWSNVLIQNNLFAGAGYTLYVGAGHTSNYKVIDNQFSTMYYPKVGYYGPWYPDHLESVTRTGNIIKETGKTVDNLP